MADRSHSMIVQVTGCVILLVGIATEACLMAFRGQLRRWCCQ